MCHTFKFYELNEKFIGGVLEGAEIRTNEREKEKLGIGISTYLASSTTEVQDVKVCPVY